MKLAAAGVAASHHIFQDWWKFQFCLAPGCSGGTNHDHERSAAVSTRTSIPTFSVLSRSFPPLLHVRSQIWSQRCFVETLRSRESSAPLEILSPPKCWRLGEDPNEDDNVQTVRCQLLWNRSTLVQHSQRQRRPQI